MATRINFQKGLEAAKAQWKSLTKRNEVFSIHDSRIGELPKEIRQEARDLLAMIEWYEEGLKVEKLAVEQMKESQGVRFKSRTFDNFDYQTQESAYKACLHYAKNFKECWRSSRNSLLLMGGNGTGKTHLAVATMSQVTGMGGVSAKFDTFANILETIRKAYGTDDDPLTQYQTVDLLVIDDLGQEKFTDWANEVYFKIINARYEKQLPTIITTNLSQQEIKALNKATYSRLHEAYRVLKMDGEDYRQKNR